MIAIKAILRNKQAALRFPLVAAHAASAEAGTEIARSPPCRFSISSSSTARL